LVVVEVPGGVVFVAGLVCVEAVELWVAVLVTVAVVVGVDWVELVVVDELEVLDELEQSWTASCLIVTAPSPRFCTNLGLTEGGSDPTLLLNASAALVAARQLPELTAAEAASSWLERVLLCSPESRPPEPPQATTKAAAKPRPPARNARERKPIRRLTLEADPVCLALRELLPVK
jgi:hypothetical protein